MKNSWRWLGLLFGILALAVPGRGAEDWIHAQTDHFDMFSASSERESRRFLNELEQFCTAFQKVFGVSSVGQPRVTVMMFDSKDQMKPFCPQYKGKTKDVAGYYQKGKDEDLIVLSADSQDRGEDGGYSIIFHEYVHKLLHEQGYNPPTWLDEGLAQFYATMRVTENSVEVGQPAQQRLRVIARSALMPLGRLFAVNHSSPEYNEKFQTQIFYAQSWLLVHFLYCGTDKNVQGKFTQFFEGVEENPTALEAQCQRVYGMNFAQMESALSGYLSGGRFNVRTVKLPIGDFAGKIRFEPMGAVERDTVLENLRWRIRPEEGSPLHMLQLAERDPKAARPYEVLAAYTLGKDRDRQQALAYWEKAVERGSINAYVYLQLAKAQLKDVTNILSLDYRAPQLVAEPIRKYLDRAVELRPDYMEAWEALAELEAVAEKPRVPVVVQIQNRVPKMRSQAKTLCALAIIRWRIGDLKTCREIIGVLKKQNLARTNVPILINRLNEKLAKAEQAKKEAEDEGGPVLKSIDQPQESSDQSGTTQARQ